MYWLFDHETFENVRQTIIGLQLGVQRITARQQDEQQFPFVGRKDRRIASKIVEALSHPGDTICDPFGGSGSFALAALDVSRKVRINEWEPYAYRMMSAYFKPLPGQADIDAAIAQLQSELLPTMSFLYGTTCPSCHNEILFDGLFYDRSPREYYHPTPHERMGHNGENIIFRNRYRCPYCGCTEKFFDDSDNNRLSQIETAPCAFPEQELIENSRLNFTAPVFTQYRNLFSKRQQLALVAIRDAISHISNEITRSFVEDAFISIIHLGKYTDYRSKSQDNHCPERQNKETNLFNRLIEKINTRFEFLSTQQYNREDVFTTNVDFRDFMASLSSGSVDCILTDPPYGDNAQYFEHAQRVHPFMGYCLNNDSDRLEREVVISNAPSRTNKHGKDQFLNDIRTLIYESSRVLKEHGYFALYIRPEQRDWISDLNKLKHMARVAGMEPLISIPTDIDDPSMRALASAAWTFRKDTCLIFIKLKESERRWYENDIDVDELVYLAALNASGPTAAPFSISGFKHEMLKQLRANSLIRLSNPSYDARIINTLNRFADRVGASYSLTGESPYQYINSEMDAEIRLYEYTPVVVDELTDGGRGFTFEEFIINLASYMENGSKKIINQLHNANSLIPGLLLEYAEENVAQGKFFKRAAPAPMRPGCICLTAMDPHEFEILIGDYFSRRHYTNVRVTGMSGDRGVDVMATNPSGELEFIQCKRYRTAQIGSTPVQRVDSMVRSRSAVRGWVITTSDFTRDGRDEASRLGIIAMNGTELLASLDVYYPGVYSL